MVGAQYTKRQYTLEWGYVNLAMEMNRMTVNKEFDDREEHKIDRQQSNQAEHEGFRLTTF